MVVTSTVLARHHEEVLMELNSLWTVCHLGHPVKPHELVMHRKDCLGDRERTEDFMEKQHQVGAKMNIRNRFLDCMVLPHSMSIALFSSGHGRFQERLALWFFVMICINAAAGKPVRFRVLAPPIGREIPDPSARRRRTCRSEAAPRARATHPHRGSTSLWHRHAPERYCAR